MMRLLAAYIMSGRTQAMVVIVVCAVLSLLVPPASYLSAGGIGLVTLRHGLQEGLVVILGATAALALLAWWTLGSLAPGVSFLLVVGLPMWVLALSLRNTNSLAYTLGMATLMGVLLIAVVHAMIGDTTVWWQVQLGVTLKPLLTESGLLGGGAQIDRLLAGLAKIFTGLLAAMMVLTMILGLFVARWWQSVLYYPGGFRQEFHGLQLSPKLALPTLALLAAALLMREGVSLVVAELLLVMLVLYVIQGLALVHRTVAKRGAHYAWLVVLYGLLLIALPQMGVLLAAVGFAASMLGSRASLHASLHAPDDKKQL
jgi:hypothetical protein